LARQGPHMQSDTRISGMRGMETKTKKGGKMKLSVIAEECRAISNCLSDVANDISEEYPSTTDARGLPDAISELHYLAERLSALDRHMGWR